MDRRANAIRDEAAVRQKFGVTPERIPDYLALVGDASDGYPGLPGIGPKGAAGLIARYGAIEDMPADAIKSQREEALLFKRLATLRTNAPLFRDVDELRWRGPTPAFAAWAKRMQSPRLLERATKAQGALAD